MMTSTDLNAAGRGNRRAQGDIGQFVKFRFEFDESILDLAYQYHNERGSGIVQFLRYVIFPLMLVAYLILIAGIMIEPGTDWVDIAMLVFGAFLFLGEFIHIKRISKLFTVTNVTHIEVCYSKEKIAFKDIESSRRFECDWMDYERWFERQGLLLLYRRRKRFDLLSYFDVIDLNQVPDKEESFLIEILRTNVTVSKQ